MNKHNDTTRIHPAVAQTILRTVDSYNVSVESLLSILKINTVSELKLNQRLSGNIIEKLWREAILLTDDAVGVNYANHFKIGSLNGLDFSWMASNTLLESFLRISRFFRVISSAGTVEVNEHLNTVNVSLILPVPYGIAENSGIDSAFALFLKLCRTAHEGNIKPITLNMRRPKPIAFESFDHFFQCPIHYNSTVDEITFNKVEMVKTLPLANPGLARANDQVVINYLKKFEIETTLSKASSIIIEALPLGTPSVQYIADQLFISSKTLQRRLKGENITFSSLLNNIRLSLAQNYLTQGSWNISEVSFLLGFTEPSNFTRWFKGVSGQSPVEYKKIKKSF